MFFSVHQTKPRPLGPISDTLRYDWAAAVYESDSLLKWPVSMATRYLPFWAEYHSEWTDENVHSCCLGGKGVWRLWVSSPVRLCFRRLTALWTGLALAIAEAGENMSTIQNSTFKSRTKHCSCCNSKKTIYCAHVNEAYHTCGKYWGLQYRRAGADVTLNQDEHPEENVHIITE